MGRSVVNNKISGSFFIFKFKLASAFKIKYNIKDQDPSFCKF